MRGPLTGIRVVDLSRILAGPWAGQLLGDFGADVIKVEHPDGGDDTRVWGPPWYDNGDAAYFLAANRNKRSIALDLKNDDDLQTLRQLLAKADVLIENFRVGTLQRFGLGAAELESINPGLIVCSITAFGQDSSCAGEPGYDAMIQGAAGLMSITGEPEEQGGEPQKVGVAVSDIMAGMYAVTGILAALHERAGSGLGQSIDLPLYDSQAGWLANQAMNFLVSGESPPRHGTGHPNLVPYQAFRSEDGHFMLAVGNDRQFSRLLDAVDAEQLRDDQRFASNAGRVTHRQALIPLLAAIFLQRNTAHWLSELRSFEVPCGPINSVAEVFSDDYAAERKLVRSIRAADESDVPTVANPLRFSRTPVQYALAPPSLAQHNDSVLQEWLIDKGKDDESNSG